MNRVRARLGRIRAVESFAAARCCSTFTGKEVAARLGISVRTVENHLRSIYAKLQITKRTRLAAELHPGRLR